MNLILFTQLDIVLNGYVIPELSTIVHTSKARSEGKRVVEKLKDTLPKQLFQVWLLSIFGHVCTVYHLVVGTKNNVQYRELALN